MTLTLAELAKAIGATLEGEADFAVASVATLEEAEPDQLSFLSNPKYEKQLLSSRAGAVIVSPRIRSTRPNLLRAPDPYLAFARAVVEIHGFRRHPHAGIHPHAVVEPTSSIGANAVFYPGVYVGARVQIGADCVLYPNAVIYDDCVLGDRVIVHAGASIGHDGFGFATSKGIHHKIPQVGNVVLEDDVEIGANTAIQRAAMGSTVIGRGSKIDSLVSIGHGTRLGEHGLIVSQAGIAGSTILGHHVTLGGQVGIAGHTRIGNNVTCAAQAGVTNDVPDGSVLLGSPALPIRHARRAVVAMTQLPDLVKRIRALEAALGVVSADLPGAVAGQDGPAED